MARWSILVALGLAACGGKPPAPPPVAKVEEPPPPPPPLPPPPKCEALEEHCAAKDDTRARIGDSGLSFQPPTGWEYAQLPTVGVATSNGAAFAVTVHEVGSKKDAKQRLGNLVGALDACLKESGIVSPKVKSFWLKRPDSTKAVGKLKFTLWQLDGASRDGKQGPLLVFTAPLPEQKALLGVGFVPEDDKLSSDAAILKAVDTISTGVKSESTFVPSSP